MSSTLNTAFGTKMGLEDQHALAGAPMFVPVAMPLQEVGKRTGVSTTDVRAGIGIGQQDDPMFTLQATAQHGVAVGNVPVSQPMACRRLMPIEAEELQGFPRNWTAEARLPDGTIKPQADGPRYKQLGNAVTVNVAEWIARRLRAAVDSRAGG